MGAREAEDRIAEARAALRAGRDSLRAEIQRREAAPLLTPDERRQLENDAVSGALGRKLEELAHRIRRGEDSWEALFRGTSPNVGLFREHLETMVVEHRDEIRRELDENPDFRDA